MIDYITIAIYLGATLAGGVYAHLLTKNSSIKFPHINPGLLPKPLALTYTTTFFNLR